MALFEILHFYKQYHAKRISENLSQKEWLWEELKLILAALVAGALLIGFLGGLAWYFTR